MTRIKPCPYCLSTKVIPTLEISKNAAIVLSSIVFVLCESCKSRGPMYEGPEVWEKLGVYAYNLKELNSIMERVIYLWNQHEDTRVKIRPNPDGAIHESNPEWTMSLEDAEELR